MAATDARPVPRKNVAYRFYFAIRKPSDSTLITSWTGADSEVSLDGADYADCTNEATEIGTSGSGYIDLTASEMNADCVLLKISVMNTGAVPLVFTLYPEESGDYRASVTDKTGYALTAAYDAAKSAASQSSVDAVGTLATSINNKTTNLPASPAAAGDAMTLTPAERDAVATTVESHLLDEGDSQMLINAIVGAIGNTNVDQAVLVAAIRADLERSGGNLNTMLARLTAARAGYLDNINNANLASVPAFPTNFAALGINVSGHISRVTLVDTTTTNTDMRGTDGAYTGTPATPTEIRQEIDANSTRLAEIVDDTTALQTDWADGGRLDLLLDQAIAYFTTARGEPAQGAPPVSATPLAKLDWLYKVMRNKADQSDSEQRIYNDDGTTVGHKRSVSVADGVVTLGEIVSGP